MDTNDIIYIGSVEFPTIVFDHETIETISCENKVDIVGNELSSDVLELSVFFDDADNVLRSVEYGTDVYYFSNENLVGKYYFSSLKRTGARRYTIYCTSLIGLVAKENFYGGFYNSRRFQDVVNDIIFRDTFTMDTWTVYAVTKPSNDTLASASLYGDTFDGKYWKYRMQADFMLMNPVYFDTNPSALETEACYICGGRYNYVSSLSGYNIRAVAYRETTSSSPYWILYVRHNTDYLQFGSTSEPLFGVGSRFFVDVDPLRKKVSVKVNYVKYDDPTVTGEVSYTGVLTYSIMPSSDTIYLGRAFSSTYYSSTASPNYIGVDTRYQNHVYYSYKLYDENNKMVLNAAAIVKQSDQGWYMVNGCDGKEVAISSDHVQAYGDPLGLAGGGTRLARDLELYNSIEYAPGIDSLSVYGWIDDSTKREALHQLLFAENVSLLKTGEGNYLFTSIADASPTIIDELVCYDDSEEQDVTPAKLITVTENTYEEDSTVVKIFDNTNSPAEQGQYIAMFDKVPIFGTLVGNGITIINFTSNAALVTGRGTISGTVYSKSRNVIGYTNDVVSDGTDVSVNNIGLITSLNSDNVMNRLKAYYCGGVKEVTNSIIYNGEKCGIKYRFRTLFETVNDGFLSKLSARVSSFVKARCMFVTGYIPPSVGGYSSFAIQTGGTSWAVPDEVRSQDYPNVRLTLIGRGSDGTPGSAGEDGEAAEEGEGAKKAGKGGAGGAAGAGGSGGLIYSVTVDVTNVKRIDVSASGINILAKTYSDGGSLLSTYTSAVGNAKDSGYTNLFDGITYGRKAPDGIPGGAGGKGGANTRNPLRPTILVFEPPEAGESVESRSGGQTYGVDHQEGLDEHGNAGYYINNWYGGGGGASYNYDGGDSQITSRSDPYVYTIGGNGADGGAARVVYTEYGSGGSGGNGGGGGGGAGTQYVLLYQDYDENTYAQEPGVGGAGGAGGAGIEGCVIIYY